MQRHNLHDVMTNPNAGNVSQIDGHPLLEHIYESPPFQRKCNSLDSPRHKNSTQRPHLDQQQQQHQRAVTFQHNGNIQYFELDPQSAAATAVKL